ncbi:flagellar hook-associated protein 3 [Sphingomonas koreensis]|nr:flagellar hook-associated protein 3 [Sphingomonas koreensis]TPG41414.1 flagellar hook-associated protein 3 [Sphingomonas koreensis]
MQISTSQFYSQSNAQMSALTDAADLLQTQISTGKKLLAPSDDVVAYQRLQSLSRAKANDSAYTGNISMAQSLVDQSDTALSSVTAQIQRAQELTVQANSGTLSDSGRQAISTELKSIVQTLASLANTKDARGGALFGGTQGGNPVTLNSDGTVTINDTGQPAAIPIGDDQSIVATDSAARVFGGVQTASGTTDLFSIINTLVTALDSGGDITAAASTAGDALSAAADQVSSTQASVGARGARLDLVTSNMTDTAVTRETERSSLEDTDVTAAITDLQKTMTILQATQASFTKLTSLSLFDYLK